MAKKEKKKSIFAGQVVDNVRDNKRSNERSYGYLKLPKGVKIWSPEVASEVGKGITATFDIIPYKVATAKHPDLKKETGRAEKGSLWYKRPFKVHRNVGPDNDTVVCLTSFGEKCPICEYATKRWKEGAEKEETKDLWAKDREMFAIVPKGDKKHEEEVHVFDISHYNFQESLMEEIDEHEEFEIFPDLEEGLTLKVRFAAASMGGKSKPYAKASRIDFVERDEAYDESILESVPDLDSLLVKMSYDEMSAKFFDVATEEEEEEEEAPKGKKEEKPALNRQKKIAEPDPEPEEEEEDEETLADQIDACKSLGALLTIATNNKEFKKSLKSFATIKKVSELKAAMMEIIEPEEEEEEEPEEEEESLVDQINAAKKVSELMEIAENNEPLNDKKTLKKLGAFVKVSGLKAAMLELLEPEEEEEEEEDEPEPPKKTPAKKPEAPKTTGKDKCPFKHGWGIGTEDHKECDKCDIWDSCIDEKERLAKLNKGKK